MFSVSSMQHSGVTVKSKIKDFKSLEIRVIIGKVRMTDLYVAAFTNMA